MKKQLIIKNEVVEMSFEEVLELFTPWIHKQINKHKSNIDRVNEEKADMFQDASLWLWKAYENYDVEKGYHFFTYADKYIKKGVRVMTEKNNAQKRKGETTSMDVDLSNDGEEFTLKDVLSVDVDLDSSLINREVLEIAVKKMTNKEAEYLVYMLNEYTSAEIAKEKGVTRQDTAYKYRKIRDKIKLAMFEYENNK